MTGPVIARLLGMARSTVGAGAAPAGAGPAGRARSQAAGDPLRARPARRADPPGHQEAGPLRRRRPPHHRRPPGGPSPPAPAGTSCTSASMTPRAWPTPRSCPAKRQEDTTAFLQRALAWLGRHGVSVERVMTDNGSAYRSKLFAKALQQAGARHVRTRPYTPTHQRQGRALHPDQPARMGLRQALSIVRPANRGHRSLDRRLQPQPTTLRHRPAHTMARVNNLLGNDS